MWVKFDAELWKKEGRKREREQKNPEEAVVCVIHHLWRSASSSIANVMIDTTYTKM